jgi:lipid A 4'-phosphatase
MRSRPSSAAHMGRGWSLRVRFGTAALLLSITAGIVFFIFPGIDQQISHHFYGGGRVFSGQLIAGVKIARTAFEASVCCFGVATILGVIFTRARTHTWLRLSFAHWLYLAICLAAGPGLVANLGFKDHWGRARPKDIIEFGGNKMFTPPLMRTDQCDNNCSFVSGEAASVFLPFYAVALLSPQVAPVLLAAGTVCGLAAGLIRIAQGAHFLSDVIFAGIFMLATVVLVHLAVFRSRLASDEATNEAAFVNGSAQELSDGYLGQVSPGAGIYSSIHQSTSRAGVRSTDGA